MKYKDMSIKELRNIAKDCYCQIHVVGCYGVSDMIQYDEACAELYSRGYRAEERHNDVIFRKEC